MDTLNQNGLGTFVRMKLSGTEFECSGSEAFVKEQTSEFLNIALTLRPVGTDISRQEPKDVQSGSPTETLSVSTIAARLKVASGPDLITASVLALTLRGTPLVNRKELADAMKSATSYYRGTYLNNLSQYLKVLVVGGKILEHHDGKFALPALVLSELNARIEGDTNGSNG